MVKNSYGLGPPFVCINGEAAAIDISLSHDGLIAAYAFATTAGNNPVSESQRHQEWALQ
jgi:hypothetical protein